MSEGRAETRRLEDQYGGWALAPGRTDADMTGAHTSATAAPSAIARAQGGDADAFEEIVAEHEQQVFRTALAILGQVEDAQDASQEVFVRLFRHLKRFDPSREVAPWLYRVTVNVCRDAARKQARGRAVGLDDVPQERLARGPDAARRAEFREEWARMLADLAHLPPKERMAFALRDIEGLSTKEVARLLGSTQMTVRSQISRARLKLKQRRNEASHGLS